MPGPVKRKLPGDVFKRAGLTLPDMGPKWDAIRRMVGCFRRRAFMEVAKKSPDGEPTWPQEVLLDEATEMHMAVLICRRLVRDNQDATPKELHEWNHRAMIACGQRRKLLILLGIDGLGGVRTKADEATQRKTARHSPEAVSERDAKKMWADAIASAAEKNVEDGDSEDGTQTGFGEECAEDGGDADGLEDEAVCG
jgi:hypothetical protein